MAKRCWTCGAPVDGWQHACPACRNHPSFQALHRALRAQVRTLLPPIGRLLPAPSGAESAPAPKPRGWLPSLDDLKSAQLPKDNLLPLDDLLWTVDADPDANLPRKGTPGFTPPRATGLGPWRNALLRGFLALDGKTVDEQPGLAAAAEWGLSTLEWRRLLQGDGLKIIDTTVRTPTQLQADEHRRMGEELLWRGVLDEAAEYFYKALKLSHLDYRIYLGLAHACLQSNDFAQAGSMLQKSLPHAPEEELDYRSYSYRLGGHIQACTGNWAEAAAGLRLALDLSPEYRDAQYDAAQYYARAGRRDESLLLLRRAVEEPLYFTLAQFEGNFDAIRGDVQELLLQFAGSRKLALPYSHGLYLLAVDQLRAGNPATGAAILRQLLELAPAFFQTIERDHRLGESRPEVQAFLDERKAEAREAAEQRISEAESRLRLIDETINEIVGTGLVVGDAGFLKSSGLSSDALVKLKLAREKLAAGTYPDLAAAVRLAETGEKLSRSAQEEATRECQEYADRFQSRQLDQRASKWVTLGMFFRLLWDLGLWAVLGGALFLVGAIFLNRYSSFSVTIEMGFSLGALCGFLIGLKAEFWRLQQIFQPNN